MNTNNKFKREFYFFVKTIVQKYIIFLNNYLYILVNRYSGSFEFIRRDRDLANTLQAHNSKTVSQKNFMRVLLESSS